MSRSTSLCFYKHNGGQYYSLYACWSFVWISLDLIPHIPLALRYSPPCSISRQWIRRILTCKHTLTHTPTHRVFLVFSKWLRGGMRQGSLKHKGSLNPPITLLPKKGCCLAARPLDKRTHHQTHTHTLTNLHTHILLSQNKPLAAVVAR